MRVNINDVAKEAGVHRSTVSRALTGSGPVSPENRDRVLAAAKKLNYHPHTIAGALKSRRRNTWGLQSFWSFTANSMDHYYAKILGGLLDSANKASHRLLLQNVVGRFDQNPEVIRFCHDSQLGGVAVLAPRTEEAELKELKRLPVPGLLLSYKPRDPELNFIDVDNAGAVERMVAYLAGKGHKRIAFVGGEVELSANARDRYEGYMQGLKRAGLGLDKRLVVNRNFEPSLGAEAAREFLALPSQQRPSAMVCSTDRMALSALEEAKAKGLSVPQDLAVCGFDNIPEAATAGLTTLHAPFYELGLQAGELLRRLEEKPEEAPLRVLLEVKLVERASA